MCEQMLEKSDAASAPLFSTLSHKVAVRGVSVGHATRFKIDPKSKQFGVSWMMEIRIDDGRTLGWPI